MVKRYFKTHRVMMLIVFVYLILASYRINYPGLQFDEVLFANAAWKRIESIFIVKTFWKIPLMVMPYIGALKSWGYFFIFRIFGVSIYSIRIPMVLLTTVSLAALYEIVNYFFNKKTALITILLLALDSSFISLTRYDVGPNAIEFFLKVISLLAIVWFLKTKNKVYLVLIAITLVFGVFNKSNFIWWVNSLFLMAVFYLVLVKKISWKKILWFLSIPLMAGIYLVSNFKITEELGIKYIFIRMPVVFIQIKNLLAGKIFYEYVIGTFSRNNWADLYWLIWMGIIVVGTWLLFQNKNYKLKVFYGLVWVGVISTFFQISLTLKANGPWHFFTVYPLITVIMALSIGQLMSIKKYKIFAYILFFILLGYLLNNYQIYSKGFSGYLTNPAWSTKIDDLALYTKSKNNKFMIMDWGIIDQLVLFDPVFNKYYDRWGVFEKPLSGQNEELFTDTYLKDDSFRYITHGKLSSIFGERSKNFQDTVKRNGYNLVLIKQISDIGRTDLFQIYKVTK